MSGQRDIFEQAMSRGHSAAWDLQWDKAIACYRAALTEFPDDPNALSSLGFAYLQSDKIEEALKMYQRAAMLAQGDPVAPEKCGEIYEQLGRLNEAAQTYLAVAEIHLTRRDIEKAIANWTRVVRITPDNLAAHSRLALAYERSGKTRQAVLEYLEVARLFQRANDNEKAAQAIARAQQLEPQSQEARAALEKLRRGVALPVPERVKGATGSLRVMTGPLRMPDKPSTDQLKAAEALSAKEASPLISAKDVALGELAEVLFEADTDTSKTSGSVTALSKGTGQLRGSQAKRAQAIMYLGQAINNQSNNNLEAAVNNYEHAVSAGLDHPMVNFALGTLYLDLKRTGDAIKYLQTLVSHKDVGLGALFGLGQAYYHEGKTREALVSLLEALKRLDMQLVASERQEALAETYETISESLMRSAETDRAKLIEGLAKFLSGDGWEERAQKARQQLDSTAEDGQVTPLADMLATPGSDQVLESLRRIEEYMGRRHWTTALEEAYYVLQFSPTHLPVHIRIAEILVAEQKQEAAIAKYAAIAATYQIRGETLRAAKIMQQVLRLSPLDVKMRSKLIELLMEQGHADEALNEYLDLADTYYQLADLESARMTYAQALTLAQKSPTPTWSVRILHAMGDIDLQRLALREALRVFEQIKMLAPGDAKANEALIDLYFRLGNSKQAIAQLDDYLRQLLSSGKAVQAVNLLEELVSSQPKERVLVARLARLYQEQGRKAEAIAQYDRLGEMQLEAGEKPQAVETIRTIIALGPENPAGYQQLLAQLQS
jgi:tetratricopeptide (TPR) repeat protein